MRLVNPLVFEATGDHINEEYARCVRLTWNSLRDSLGERIMWNYYGPAPTMDVLVNGGVSYDSDLNRVEEIVMNVCREVAAASDSATKDVEPFFGYDKFDDSNVRFWVFMQATDRFGSFILTSEIIKGIHNRFKQEDITINYPMRNVMLRDSDGLPQIPNAPWPSPSRPPGGGA